MSSNPSNVAPQVNDVVPYQGGSTLAHFKSQLKIWSTLDPQNHHMLSSCMHCSLMVS